MQSQTAKREINNKMPFFKSARTSFLRLLFLATTARRNMIRIFKSWRNCEVNAKEYGS